MRVAFTLEQCWHAVPGGTAVAAIELARALEDRGTVELVGVAASHRSNPREPWVPPIPVAQLPLPREALYEAWHRLRRPSVERATGPVDVIHATGIAMPPATRAVVSTVHDLSYLDYPEMFSRAGRRFFQRALELTLADARLVLCSSQATLARCTEAGFAEARLRHVPLGVRVEPTTDERVREVRSRLPQLSRLRLGQPLFALDSLRGHAPPARQRQPAADFLHVSLFPEHAGAPEGGLAVLRDQPVGGVQPAVRTVRIAAFEGPPRLSLHQGRPPGMTLP